MEKDLSSNGINVDSPDQRLKRFTASSILRFSSAIIQLWGGYTGNQSALIIEGAEELTDSFTFAAAAIEIKTNKKGITQKARNTAISFAVSAALLASYETITEIMQNKSSLLSPLEGINLSSSQYEAAIGALAINSVVFFLNRKGHKSSKVSDRFAFRDSVRDSFIPGAVLGLSAINAPHIAEYAFEIGGVSYGWYNAVQLYKGWRNKRPTPQNKQS